MERGRERAILSRASNYRTFDRGQVKQSSAGWWISSMRFCDVVRAVDLPEQRVVIAQR